ncbi:TolC family protein [Chitinophagaceae bacterium LB-8]|uniref:TolC family protein n=1 Tax=Paraflavisolibacter caeni TaxID=2982496 RepID=A0A9X3BIG9_9BACT|nr:TolC family protein [Paraflavisolibacter caeni]MCU7551332.1 TolC family protein [Paraflavisolibacter caeni]
MKKQPIIAFLLTLIFFTANAQNEWDLRKCIEYALANNISVKQADLQVRFSELVLRQNKASQIPSLNMGINSGFSYGRSENPTTGTLQNANFFNATTGMQSGVSLFNWFALKNTIAASRLTVEADLAQLKKVQDDIALNVAVAYLQVLLAGEQANVTAVQVKQTQSQLESTRKQVAAGKLPELNAAELEAQLARDSSSLVTAQASIQQYTLQLKALLNLDAGAPFKVATPSVETIPLESLAELQPETVYAQAIANLPQQKANELRIQSALKSVQAAKGNMYPALSAYGNLNNRYAYFKKQPFYEQVITGYKETPNRVVVDNGSFYPVQVPVTIQGGIAGYVKASSLSEQFKANFGQSFGVSLQVPLFNNRTQRTAWERSKLNVRQYQLQDEADRQTLKQDIYKAYTDAMAALQKYNAYSKSVEAAAKAANFAQRRYDLNLLSTYELINSQNNLLRTRIEMLQAQYDYVFKMKLLEFYKGQGIKL